MSRLFLFILVVPIAACGQSTTPPAARADLAAIYTQAIEDFITAANQRNATAFDTLYIAKRQTGQPDDFPDITLPDNIENTQIILITPAQGEVSQREHKTRTYINLMGWVDKETAEFLFIVFSNGFDHQYDYTIAYTYNPKDREFELQNIQFKGPPFDK